MKFTIDFDWVIPFFDSNFFLALVAIASVAVVIWVYQKQKQDKKENAARIVLREIIDCENVLDGIRTHGINLANTRQILPINNWNRYKHLFAKDLDERELRLIDTFYSECETLNEELREAYSLPHYWQEKARIIAEKHMEFSANSRTQADYERKKKTLQFFEQDGYWWQPAAPVQQLMNRVRQIRYISSTNAESKLKKIARL